VAIRLIGTGEDIWNSVQSSEVRSATVSTTWSVADVTAMAAVITACV
jgi:hypothetical protein